MNRLSLNQIAHLLNGRLLGDNAGFTGVSTDSRRLRPGELFIALQGPNFDGHHFLATARERGAAGALVSRPQVLDLPQVQVEDTRSALGRLGAIWRDGFPGKVIALTGSNGKTTVKEMLAAILGIRNTVLATQGNLNNDIGVPLTLLRLRPEHDCAVIEMGANHQGEIAYLTRLVRPDVALLNNAAPCHLEGFGDLAGVARGKGEIFQGLGPTGVAIINRDDPYADYWSELVQGRRIMDFALDRSARVSAQILDPVRSRFRLTTADDDVVIELPLLGRHNVLNALAAAAAGLAVGATLDDIRRGLQGMQGVMGRLQRLTGPAGSTVIHDAYNANPASLAAALTAVAALTDEPWLVLGDMAELGPETRALHRQAGEQALRAGFCRLYGIGDFSREAVTAFGKGGVHFATVEALLQALQQALENEAGADTVVLIKGSRSMRMERIVHALVSQIDSTHLAGVSW